jgi:cAMP-dependent protein kinase regulator
MSVVDGLPFADEKKKYILETLDPILEEMVSDVLTEMPALPLDFMIQWLRKRSGTAQALRVSMKQKNASLKQELSQATNFMQEAGSAMAVETQDAEVHSEEEEDDECDDIPESFKKPEAQMGRARQSVSAEAYGQWNQKKEFTPPVHPKSDEQKARLNSTLQQSFMFQGLENADMQTILMAMQENTFAPDTKVINEGDDGDFLFVIEKGTLECKKVIGGEEKVVKTCTVGDVFGELALLYNCPRAATVVAKDDCVCWKLDRETFNHIVKDAAVKRRNKHEQFLSKVHLLQGMDQYEKSQIADALKTETYSKGDFIVKQDDPGDKFYILEEGTAYAEKSTDGTPKRVLDYKPGDYFGELALLKNQPRAASVIVQSDTATVLCLGRQSFNKMLGPLQDLLKRNQQNYA